jgi:hypothetical protein
LENQAVIGLFARGSGVVNFSHSCWQFCPVSGLYLLKFVLFEPHLYTVSVVKIAQNEAEEVSRPGDWLDSGDVASYHVWIVG